MIVVSKFWRRAWPAALVTIVLCGCLSSPQEKEARFLASGKLHYAKKDYQRAILDFKNAIQSAPRDAEAYYQLGLAYAGADNLPSAYSCFKKATDLNPKHAQAQLKVASLMLMTDKKELAEDAERRMKKTLATSPATAEALSTLAFSELRLGREQDAVGYLQQALNKFPADLNAAVLLMRVKLNKGDTAGAEELLKNCVAKAPRSPEAVLALGRFYLVTKKFEQARQQFRRALEINPNYGVALKDLGMLQIQQGQNQEAEQTFKRLAALPDKAYKPLHALFLIELGQRDAALREFEQLAAADPSDREARTRLVSAYIASDRRADAQKVLNDALDKNRKDADALVQRAALFLGEGKYAEAQSDLNQVLRFRPDIPQAHVALAALHEARGETLIQRRELTEALRLNPTLLAVRLSLARSLLASREPEAALEVLGNAFDSQKRSVPFIVEQNWALLALGRREELRQKVDRALKAVRVPDLLVQDAILKFQDKNYTGAQSSLDEVLNKNPENQLALQTLVRMYAAQRKVPEAIKKIQSLVAKQPKSAVLLATLGNLLAADGKPAEARSAYVQANAADPNYTDAILALANLDASEGKFDSARQGLTKVQTMDPKNVQVWIRRGGLEANQKNYPEAIGCYRRVLELEPRNAIALNNLAYLLATQVNQADDALKYAQQAKEIAPDLPDIDDTLGWVLYNRGAYQSASGYLQSAMKKHDDPAIRYHLAMTYTRLGDKRGPQMLREALRVAPNLPEAGMAQSMLVERSAK